MDQFHCMAMTILTTGSFRPAIHVLNLIQLKPPVKDSFDQFSAKSSAIQHIGRHDEFAVDGHRAHDKSYITINAPSGTLISCPE